MTIASSLQVFSILQCSSSQLPLVRGFSESSGVRRGIGVYDHGEAVPSKKSFKGGRCSSRFVWRGRMRRELGDLGAVESEESPICVAKRAALYMLDPSLCDSIVVCVGSICLNPSLSSLHLVLHLAAPLVPGLRGIEWRRRCRTAQSQHCLRLGRQA
jgi:hypothetical protein